MSVKVKKIRVENLKKISLQEVEMQGGSLIVTAANESGKSSLIKSLLDRLTGEKSVVLREGEKKGSYIAELTDGAKIEWNFTEKSETFVYISKDGVKQTTGVISFLLEKYFGNKKRFDIDKFLSETPKQQAKMLCNVLNINLDEVNNRYQIAYSNRTDAKKEFDLIVANKKTLPAVVEMPHLQALKNYRQELVCNFNTELNKVKYDNQELRKEWERQNENLRNEIESFNKIQDQKNLLKQNAANYILNISSNLNLLSKVCFFKEDSKDLILQELENFYQKIEIAEPKQTFVKLPEPNYLTEPKQSENKELQQIESEIEIANQKMIEYNNYIKDLQIYNEWIESGKKARLNVENCEKIVKEITEEKNNIIKNANLPEGFEFDNELNLLYNGFALNKNVQSTSAIYIAALKLATLNLGELKTDYFEASALDKKNLQKVLEYANSKGLQLFIERPDFNADDNEIRIEVLENKD